MANVYTKTPPNKGCQAALRKINTDSCPDKSQAALGFKPRTPESSVCSSTAAPDLVGILYFFQLFGGIN